MRATSAECAAALGAKRMASRSSGTTPRRWANTNPATRAATMIIPVSTE